MLRLKDAIDEKTLIVIQRMFMQFLHSSTALYELDGAFVYSVFEGEYCEFLNEVSYKNAGSCKLEAYCSGKWICHEDCWKISKESIDKGEPVEKECSGGIYIYAVPIFYNGQVIGSINAGITNPPLDKNRLKSVAEVYRTDEGELLQRAYAYKRLTSEEMEMARLQLRMAALLISSLYESKVKQLEAEMELKHQKEELEAILETLQDNITIIDEEGKYLKKSSIDLEQFERTDADIWTAAEKTSFFDLEGNPLSKDELCHSKLFRGEKVTNLKLKQITNGKEKYLNLNGVPVFDENNKFKMGVVFSVDITDAVNLTARIKRQKEQLEVIIENMDDAVFIFDSDRKYYLVNKAAREYFPEYELNTFGEAYDTYKYYDINNNEVSFENMTISKVFKGEVVIDQKLTLRNSTITKHISVNGRPIFDQQGNIKLAVLCSRDITGDIEIQRRIEQQNELLSRQAKMMKHVNDRLSVALESVNAGIWECDVRTNNQVWSPKVYEIYGIDPRESVPLDRGISRIIPEDREDFKSSWNKALRGDSEFWQKDFRISHPQRGIVWLKGTGKFIYNESGDPIKMIGINIDITEQKLQQEKLLKAEKEKNDTLENAIRMKDEFLSLISHEFKTPLTVINSAIQAMEVICKDELSDKARGFINKIRQNSYRQLRLVNNLLDITRANAGRVKINKRNLDIVFITKAIVESVNLYALNKGIKLSFVSSLRYKIIGIDEEKYERILLNLLSNAIKYTPSGEFITVALRSSKAFITVEVKDTGVGVPADKQELIFEKFGQVDSSLTRQAEGTGIGLSLVKMLVEALDGTITLKSKEGRGSTFSVLLPAVKVQENPFDSNVHEISDNRLVQATSIEFSDIYLSCS